MNWNQIEGNWEIAKGKIREMWGDLTDDDVTAISGKRQQLAGKLQERYGYALDKAEQEIDGFLAKFDKLKSGQCTSASRDDKKDDCGCN